MWTVSLVHACYSRGVKKLLVNGWLEQLRILVSEIAKLKNRISCSQVAVAHAQILGQCVTKHTCMLKPILKGTSYRITESLVLRKGDIRQSSFRVKWE